MGRPPRCIPARAEVGNRFPSSPSSFSPYPRPLPRPGLSAPGAPPLRPSSTLCREVGDEGLFCPKAPPLPSNLLRVPTPLSLFPKEALPIFLFADQPYHYMKIILNISLLFPRVTLTLSNIINKSFPYKSKLQIGPRTLSASSAYHFMRQKSSKHPETLPHHF